MADTSDDTAIERWFPIAVIAVLSASTLAIAMLVFRSNGLLVVSWLPPPEPAPWGSIDIESFEFLDRAVLITWLVGGEVAAIVLLLVARCARRTSAMGIDRTGSSMSSGTWMPSEVGMAMGMMAFTLLLAGVTRFRFRMDDFHYLSRATRKPFNLDHVYRLLTTMAHFQIGIQLGHGHLWFATVNLLTLAAMCGTWGLLVHRAGLSRNASLIAASLMALAPGTLYLLKTGNGIEHLAATTCLFVVLLLVDLGSRGHSLAWRQAMLILALCLATLGVLMKHQVMLVLAPSCWLWGRWFVPNPKRPFDRSSTYLAFLVALALPLVTLPLDPNPSRIGFSPWLPAWFAWWGWIERYGLVVLMLQSIAVARRIVWTPVEERPKHGLMATEREGLSAILRTLRAPVGRVPLMAWGVILTALWCAPFQINAGWAGMDYYAMLMSAPAGAIAAALIDAMESPPRHWIGRITVAAAVAAILFPVQSVRVELGARTADDRLDRWLGEVHELLRDQPAPRALVVELDCGFDGDLGTSGRIDDFFAEEGIRWATGWYEVPLEFRVQHDVAAAGGVPAPDIVTLRYCPGEPAVLPARTARGKW